MTAVNWIKSSAENCNFGISDPCLSASLNKAVAKEFQNRLIQMQGVGQVIRDPQKIKSCSYPIPQARLFRPLTTLQTLLHQGPSPQALGLWHISSRENLPQLQNQSWLKPN